MWDLKTIIQMNYQKPDGTCDFDQYLKDTRHPRGFDKELKDAKQNDSEKIVNKDSEQKS